MARPLHQLKTKGNQFRQAAGAGKRRTRYVVDDHCCAVGFVVTRLHCTRRRWINSPVAGNRTRRFRYQPPDRAQDGLTFNSTPVIAFPAMRFRLIHCRLIHCVDG